MMDVATELPQATIIFFFLAIILLKLLFNMKPSIFTFTNSDKRAALTTHSYNPSLPGAQCSSQVVN